MLETANRLIVSSRYFLSAKSDNYFARQPSLFSDLFAVLCMLMFNSFQNDMRTHDCNIQSSRRHYVVAAFGAKEKTSLHLHTYDGMSTLVFRFILSKVTLHFKGLTPIHWLHQIIKLTISVKISNLEELLFFSNAMRLSSSFIFCW